MWRPPILARPTPSATSNSVVTTPEIWEGNQWVKLPGAGTLQIPYYPRNFIDPKNGLVFMAAERIMSRWFDPDGSAAGGRGSAARKASNGSRA